MDVLAIYHPDLHQIFLDINVQIFENYRKLRIGRLLADHLPFFGDKKTVKSRNYYSIQRLLR